MIKQRQRRRPIVDINVVPYIDVMLVLLMIFMITAPLLTQGVHINLPKASAKELSSEQQMPIVVSVNKAGEYFLNTSKKPKSPLSASELSNQVSIALGRAKQQHQQRDIYVRGDSGVDYGRVVQAMVLLQKIGVKNVGLITQDPDTKKA
jgi:biopolymer transport protein TolR